MLTPDTLLKAMVDETRLRCLMLLMVEVDLCVCEFGYALGVAQPKISRHLGLLRKDGVLLDRKSGQWVHYRFHPDLPAWALVILQATAQGLTGLDPYRDDVLRLHAMPNRPEHCQ